MSGSGRQLEVLCPLRMFTPKHVGNTDACERCFVRDRALCISVKTQTDKQVCMCIVFINTLAYICVLYVCVCVCGGLSVISV